MRLNFHVNISEQFTIRDSIEGSVHMDLSEDVDEDDYLRKEVSCNTTSPRDVPNLLSLSTVNTAH